MIRRLLPSLLVVMLVILILCVAGCGMFGGGPKPVKPAWKTLALVAAPDANGNSALAVDVVLVRDSKLLDTLLVLPAAKYFAATASLQRSYPDQMSVLPFEITPGQKIDVERTRFKDGKVWAVLAFANYATPGEHRARLALDQDHLVIDLATDDFAAPPAK